MRKLIILLILIHGFAFLSSSQNKNDFSTQWKKVSELENKGLTASALLIVNKIFDDAVKSKNTPQQLKAAMYKMKYRNQVEEDNLVKNIYYLDTLITRSESPAKNILLSMQAELLNNYKISNRHKYYGQTQFVNDASTDIENWSIGRLNTTIRQKYLLSLTGESALQQVNIEKFADIIQKGNSRKLRPTLYDLLAHRALDHFMDAENDINSPVYKFILNDPALFGKASAFIDHRIQTQDTASNYLYATRILQSLLKFHSSQTGKDAFIDADLKRLEFVNQHGVFAMKDSLYETALITLENEHKLNPLVARAMFLRAQLYFTRGSGYQHRSNPSVQYEIKKSKYLLDKIISEYPGSEGALMAKNLRNQVTIPELQMTTESVNLPGVPFRSLVTYKNIEKVYFRIYKTNRQEYEMINGLDEQEAWRRIFALQPAGRSSQVMPNLNDFQNHSAEIKFDALTPGVYYIVGSKNENFGTSSNIMVRQLIYISNLSYILNSGRQLYALNRDNGFPLSSATIQVWETSYDYPSRRYIDTKKEKYISDRNGMVQLPKLINRNRQEFYEVIYKDESFAQKDPGNIVYHNDYRQPSRKSTFLFTDRSLYRPGQQVFFKGLMISTDSSSKLSSLLTNYKTKLILYDANRQKIAVKEIITNQYGSYNGSFDLPSGVLNGMFYMQDSLTNSMISFNVEEYKRPGFYVEIMKPSGSYRINEVITVNGIAKAYAGNNLSQANVSYRVVRKFRYPIWLYNFSYRIWPPHGSRDAMEISYGNTKTDANGNFAIQFKAIPDERTEKKFQPVFEYEIIADVTDEGGESRTGKTIVPVSYQAVQLNIESDEEIQADSLGSIKIRSTNINGIHENVNLKLKIEKLKNPGKVFRKRYWETPDQFVMSKEEFYKNFPHDPYAEEDQPVNWPVESVITDKQFSTTSSGNWPSPASLQPGWYKISVTGTDRFNEIIVSEKFMHVVSPQTAKENENLSVVANNQLASPGETVNVRFLAGKVPVWLIRTTEKTSGSLATSYEALKSQDIKEANIPITEADRGGINIGYNYVLHNRFYSGNKMIAVPWSNKELKISYETFRDKVLPGSNETWKIRINGPQSEKIAAEAIVSMYDASLDQFKAHNWSKLNSVWPSLSVTNRWSAAGFGSIGSEMRSYFDYSYAEVPQRIYDALLNIGWSQMYYRGRVLYESVSAPSIGMAPQAVRSKLNAGNIVSDATQAAEQKEEESQADTIQLAAPANQGNVDAIRKNFNETAFFFPSLTTDQDGNIEFNFTIPEALTQWKLMILAHTSDLRSAYSDRNVITQKPLMVQPNVPRFMREGDDIELPAKIVNMTGNEIVGTAQLELYDAATGKGVDGWFKNVFPNQYFTVAPGQSFVVRFPVSIPVAFGSALKYRIKAISKDGSFSDGEESILPVLTNRILVTETLPLNLINTNQKTFRFDNLLNSAASGSLSHQSLTLEYSSNPAWYAVQSLPYLMEYPYDCSEQQFNRYFANTLAYHITGSIPRIKQIFETWKIKDTAALLSNLQKNPELKSALLQETPWVLNAQNENQQKKNIAILFDMVRVSAERNKILQKLTEMQTANGGFSWFKGGRDDRYITQYILSGIGHLKKLNALNAQDLSQLQPMISKGIKYLDARLADDYNELVKRKTDLSKNNTGGLQVHWLYMRSFFSEKMNSATKKAYDYYNDQSRKFWLSYSKNFQAMIALYMNRAGKTSDAQAIARSLKENAIIHPELGMYWKELAAPGYYWHQAPIENQALMIELFSEVAKETTVINALKVWLLKNKQTNSWESTKATAEACYALLLNGDNWLSEEKQVTLTVGNLKIENSALPAEAGTGYFKTAITGEKVKQGMGNITVRSEGTSPSWGAAYWQYFEEMDKVGYAATPIKVSKTLYVQTNSDRGPVLNIVKEGAELKVGQLIKVRIEIKVDRDMEYVHLKDLRPVTMEPTNVISQFKYQGGLGYYEMTKDASTNFFFSYLPRGSYSFEYPMFVTHAGNFSNGMASVQCLYAPEFTSHSRGSRISVAAQ